MKQRIEYLDSLKAVSILLVVFCHYVLMPNETVLGNMIMALSWCAVPCFMMVSGGLMHRSNRFEWKKYLKKIAKLYIILVLWRGIYLLVHIFVANVELNTPETIQYLFFFSDIKGVNTGVMWYMNAFLLVQLFYPVTHYLFCSGETRGRQILIFLLILFAISGIAVPSFNWISNTLSKNPINFTDIYNIMPFTKYANMLFYFVLGAFLLEYRGKINNRIGHYRYIFPLLIVIGTVCLIMIKRIDSGSYAWNGIYIIKGYNRVATALLSLGMYLTFASFNFGKIYRYFSWIGRYTMGIYYIHYILLFVCSVYLYPLIQDHYFFGINSLKTLIITAVCVVLTRGIQRIPYINELVK